MTAREKLAAFRAAVPGATVRATPDEEAVELAREIAPRHGEQATAAAAAFAAALALPRPTDDAGLEAWVTARGKARSAFWAEFEGEVVDGVTIIQVRS